MMRPILSIALAAGVSACGKEPTNRSSLVSRLSSQKPDELPTLMTAEQPFRYPPELYARKVQGNVSLRLFIDRDGRVVLDSTQIVQPSGYPELDSAALRGAPELRFVPAKLKGEPIGTAVIFPVYFRHPEAKPLPMDTILKQSKPE